MLEYITASLLCMCVSVLTLIQTTYPTYVSAPILKNSYRSSYGLVDPGKAYRKQ